MQRPRIRTHEAFAPRKQCRGASYRKFACDRYCFPFHSGHDAFNQFPVLPAADKDNLRAKVAYQTISENRKSLGKPVTRRPGRTHTAVKRYQRFVLVDPAFCEEPVNSRPFVRFERQSYTINTIGDAKRPDRLHEIFRRMEAAFTRLDLFLFSIN
jgi:hypothetical protein